MKRMKMLTSAAALLATAFATQTASAQLAAQDYLFNEWCNGDTISFFNLGGPWVTGLSNNYGLCRGPGNQLYTVDYVAGTVLNITTSGAPPTTFATGLSGPVVLWCNANEMWVAEYNTGEVTNITAGGDFSATPAFATGLPGSTLLGIYRTKAGGLYVSVTTGGAGDGIYDITAGGDFSGASPYATVPGGCAYSLTENNGALLASDLCSTGIYDVTAGGVGVPWATNLPTTLGGFITFSSNLIPPFIVGLSFNGEVYVVNPGDNSANTPFATGLGNCTVEQAVYVHTCGDGAYGDYDEDCDDGGETATCDDDCTFVVCGDATVNATAGETCDDGGESATCDDDCTAVVCGDSNVNTTAGETCDDGGESATCDDDCTAVVCGDSNVNTTAGETCDDGGESAT
jgi:hypothetical protein